jgi:hypothetical protein
MASKDLNAAFASIINDCQAIAIEAVGNAAKQVQTDIVNEAKSYLQKYYSNYTPKRYKRTGYLKNAITPVFESSVGKKSASFEIGVEYDSSKLANHYKSNSWYHQSGGDWISSIGGGFDFDSQSNGIPQPDWILTNFLEGEHGGYHKDSESTNSLMEEFFEVQLPKRIEQYVQNELFAAITSRL